MPPALRAGALITELSIKGNYVRSLRSLSVVFVFVYLSFRERQHQRSLAPVMNDFV